jgi:hypothetical protein
MVSDQGKFIKLLRLTLLGTRGPVTMRATENSTMRIKCKKYEGAKRYQ